MGTGPQHNYKQTRETVGKLEEALSLGMDITDACVYAGISRDTLYRWQKESPGLSDRFKLLQQKLLLRAYRAIAKNLDNPKMALAYIKYKRRSPQRESVEPPKSTWEILEDELKL